MRDKQQADEVNVEFIRLLFRSPIEEQIAYDWVTGLARLIGSQVMQLRASTTLAEIDQWLENADAKIEGVVKLFEIAPGTDDEVLYPEQTFREFVERLAARYRQMSATLGLR
jgi:hypothetical protein